MYYELGKFILVILALIEPIPRDICKAIIGVVNRLIKYKCANCCSSCFVHFTILIRVLH